jgi:hypothetical protein
MGYITIGLVIMWMGRGSNCLGEWKTDRFLYSRYRGMSWNLDRNVGLAPPCGPFLNHLHPSRYGRNNLVHEANTVFAFSPYFVRIVTVIPGIGFPELVCLSSRDE